jgi:adenosine kinase
MQLPRLTGSQLNRGITGAEILIGNDYEIGLLQRKTGLKKETLLKKVRILVTTLAEKGSLIEMGRKAIEVKAARPLRVCDPVGAGDAYRAGFVAGFLKKLDLETCGQVGAVAAVYTVEKYGTITHRFTRREFCDRFERNFRKRLALV